MTHVGIAGIGFMGMIHFLAYQGMRGVKVAALCTRDQKRRTGDWRSIRGNFGPAGKKVNLQGVRTYSKLEDLIADAKIDLIDVCLPPALHANATIKSLRAGKHVFCEKPLALTVPQAGRMMAAAKATDRALMVGHVLPFFPAYAQALKIIGHGKYGRPLGGHFKRIISRPLWIHDYFDPQTHGGPMLDLHIHDAHLIRHIWGMPRAVFSTGRLHNEVAEYFTTQFVFSQPEVAVSATSGVINQQGRSFTQSFELHLEQATLLFDSSVIKNKSVVETPLTILTAKGSVIRPTVRSTDPIDIFRAEIREVLQRLQSPEKTSILDSHLARDALLLCQKQTQSIRSGKLARLPKA